jgi:multidrug resistance efflux pump
MLRRLFMMLLLLGSIASYAGYRLYQSRLPYVWSGTVEAHTVALGSRVGGRVAEVTVREGDTVEAGALLVRLEAGDLEAQIKSAQASVTIAEATARKLERGIRRERVSASSSRVSAADAALLAAQTRFDRAQKLVAAGAAAQADLDAADAQLKAAKADREAAGHQYEELRDGNEREDIEVANAQVEVAKARVEQLQIALGELSVFAPRAGRVESIPVRPGDLASPNSTVATLVENDQLYVRIYVPETQLGLLTVGGEVPVTVDSFPETAFKGRVEHINTQGEYSPRNLQTADERADQVFGARVELVEGLEKVRPGMAAFISIPRNSTPK